MAVSKFQLVLIILDLPRNTFVSSYSTRFDTLQAVFVDFPKEGNGPVFGLDMNYWNICIWHSQLRDYIEQVAIC